MSYKEAASHTDAMSRALLLAHKCTRTRDVPVGAIVVDGRGRIIGEGRNRRVEKDDPTAHAEIEALRDAGRNVGSWNLSGCTLVVTLEPCTMCAGAAVAARVSRVVFGAWDEKAGACGSVRDVVRDARMNHQAEVIPGVMEEEATTQLKAFFAERRRANENPHSDFWSGRIDWADATPFVGIPAITEPAADSRRAAPTPQDSDSKNLENAPTYPTPPPAGRRSDKHVGRIVVPPLSDTA